MAFIVNDIRGLLTLRIKDRQDDYVDQYCRIFLVKICLVSCLITGFDYFNDKVSCILPSTSSFLSQPTFVPSACWIQGFYIYKELELKGDNSGYYGIPSNLQHNGMKPDGSLCNANSPTSSEKCVPMTKIHYMHYQVMPFFIAGMAILFYMPYLLFAACNSDIKSLKCDLKALGQSTDADCLLKTYFYPNVNSKLKMHLRILGTVLVKVAYLVATLLCFNLTNLLLYGRFFDYGLQWVNWGKIKSTSRFEVATMGGPTPGNRLLPTMGLCQVHEASRDEQVVYSNRGQFICELSPHILYQFVLLVMWFVQVIGIAVSALGVIHRLLSCLMTAHHAHSKTRSTALSVLTLREMEYLDHIRKHSLPLYGDALRKLQLVKRSDDEANGFAPLTANDGYL